MVNTWNLFVYCESMNNTLENNICMAFLKVKFFSSLWY